MDFQKISLTAKLAAYLRGFTDIPFAREVTEFLNAQEAFEQLLHAHQMRPEDLLWYAPIFEVRYKSSAAFLQQMQCTQVLELASGFSLRGLVVTLDTRVVYVESDLDDLTQEKTFLVSELCRRHGIGVPPHLHFAVVNALEPRDLEAAVRVFQRDESLTIVHEGLLQYLSAQELEHVARNIRELLKEFGGMWLTPDFSINPEAADISAQQKKFRAIVAAATDRQMYNNAFENENKLLEFFDALGFNVNVFRQRDLVPQLVSANALDLSPVLVEQLTSPLKLWMLTV